MSVRIPIAWAEVRNRLELARSYWICTASAAGGPHAMPVWGVWVNGRLWFSTGPATVKARNLAADPRVAVHLENASDLVELRGRATQVPPDRVPAAVDATYTAKYVMPRTGQGVPITVRDSRVYAVTPVTGHSWFEGAFVESMTRWRFGAPGRDPVAEEIGYGG